VNYGLGHRRRNISINVVFPTSENFSCLYFTGHDRFRPIADIPADAKASISLGWERWMLAFEIEIDGERNLLAGTDDWDLLSFHLDATREDARRPDLEVTVSMGGLTQEDENGIRHHVRWGRRELQVGAKVVLTVVDTERPDPPIRRYRSDREVQEDPYTDEEIAEFERADYLRLKAKFEPETGK
jgi:hypothetical protein